MLKNKVWIYPAVILVLILVVIISFNLKKDNEESIKVGGNGSNVTTVDLSSTQDLKNDTSIQNCMDSRKPLCSKMYFSNEDYCQTGDVVAINDYKCVCVDICPENALCEFEVAWECSRTLADAEKNLCCGSGVNEFCVTVAKAKEVNFSCQNNCQWDGGQFYNCKLP